MDSFTTGEKVWGIAPELNDTYLNSAQEIQNYLQCHPVVARLLWNRGLKSVQLLDRFLKPELSQLPDPFSIIDMKKAASRIAEAVINSEKIAVYGDYDVDGTCGSALLFDFFRSIGVEIVNYQPDRFTEGYGVHCDAIERLIKQGAKVIITVDCGITAVEPARLAKDLGATLVVIDHHKVGAALPDAFAIVNPQRPEDTSRLFNVCGSGLAFFFAAALRAELRGRAFFKERPEPNLVRLLDLVAVATVADVVDIRGANRILVTHGLKVLGKTTRVGLRALLEAAKVERPTAMHCGFVIGPRINAAGRLKSARAALELLTSSDPIQARTLAEELEKINLERRATQDLVHAEARVEAQTQIDDPRWKELRSKIPASQFEPWPRALVLAPPENNGRNWHEGVIGIVASKIVEEFGRPTFILAEKEGDTHGPSEILKGSVRSIPKIDILAAISAESVAKHLLNFGGHAHAGGVTLRRDKLDAFREALNEHLAVTTSAEDYKRERRFDAEVTLEEIDGKLVEELSMLEPFGQKFPEPVFKVSRVSCATVRVMKEKHLKLQFKGNRVEAVWFNAARIEQLENGEPCSLWISPQWNEWQGVKRLQLQVRHAEI